MKDKEVVEYLEKYGSIYCRPGLETILKLCDKLDVTGVINDKRD